MHGPIWPAAVETDLTELYNRRDDPDENINLAADPSLKDVVAALSVQLRSGWRA